MAEYEQPVHGRAKSETAAPVAEALTIQRRLQVGRADDPAEIEADRVADSVVGALRTRSIQHDLPLRDPGRAGEADARIHRNAAAIRRRAAVGAEGGAVPQAVEQRIQRMRGGGTRLAEPVKRSMEGAFGADFGAVRVHSGAESTTLNQELGAKAFTTGNDIFFRGHVPDATTSGGQSLLAHELTHTIQQGGSVARTIRRKKSDDLATLVGATLSCTERNDPTIKGHSMEFDLTLSIPGKAGVQHVKSIDAGVAHSVYGVTMEWWEEIIVDYDFTEADPAAVQAKKQAGTGKSIKPWSDIYLSNPQSQTFFRWKNSVKGAQGGTLSGTHVTGVNDNPSVNLSADSYKRRVLRFRINATDAHGASHKFDAIQVLVAGNGVLTSSVYEDSAGNKLIAGTGERELMRFSSTVPLSVRQGDATNFTSQIKGKQKGVRKYVNTELTQVEQQAMTLDPAYFEGTRGNIYKELQQSNRLNGAPLIPQSDKYLEFTASDGGLLVAQVSGKVVKRMYHTKNQTRQIPVSCNGKPVQMTVREFEQLPPEMFNKAS